VLLADFSHLEAKEGLGARVKVRFASTFDGPEETVPLWLTQRFGLIETTQRDQLHDSSIEIAGGHLDLSFFIDEKLEGCPECGSVDISIVGVEIHCLADDVS
jgi:hypothetical protein